MSEFDGMAMIPPSVFFSTYLADAHPEPGLLAFAAVVVLTMLAVESFDPRLIWDPASSREVHHA